MPTGLDAKILERWARYLDKTHDHPFLGFWPDLVAKGSQAEATRAAEAFQRTVDTVVREYREISEYNERVIEESKKSTDPYDIFCKGCTAETRALPRNKYVFRGDLFDAKRKTDGESRDAGVLYLDDEELVAYLSSDVRGRLDRLKAELAAAKKALPEKYPFLHILTDAKETRDMPLHRRGDPYNLGEPVPRHFLSVLANPEPAPLKTGSGRLDLANQIASPANPLTARVMVNRIWHHHFGAGLVRSLSNLGAAGDRPSHPELLDYLAVQLVENGWSIKKIHREILLSSVYAMDSHASEQALAADPENRLLSRFNRRRVDVETLRDSMLFVSGESPTRDGRAGCEVGEGLSQAHCVWRSQPVSARTISNVVRFSRPVVSCGETDSDKHIRPASLLSEQRVHERRVGKFSSSRARGGGRRYCRAGSHVL